MSPDLVWVEWVDSVGNDGWTNRGDLAELARATGSVVTVGFLLDDEDAYLTVAGTLHADSPDGDVLSPLVIPRSAVRRIWRLVVS